MPREPSKLLSVRVSRRVSARLGVLAQKRHVPVSQIVREAVERYALSEEPSMWEAAKHLFEAKPWRGPKDLSTNKKHMKGYGR